MKRLGLLAALALTLAACGSVRTAQTVAMGPRTPTATPSVAPSTPVPPPPPSSPSESPSSHPAKTPTALPRASQKSKRGGIPSTNTASAMPISPWQVPPPTPATVQCHSHTITFAATSTAPNPSSPPASARAGWGFDQDQSQRGEGWFAGTWSSASVAVAAHTVTGPFPGDAAPCGDVFLFVDENGNQSAVAVTCAVTVDGVTTRGSGESSASCFVNLT